jgi:hypothetical protein
METHGAAPPTRILQPSRSIATDIGIARGGIIVYLDAVHDAVHCIDRQQYTDPITHRSTPCHNIIITRHTITHADGHRLSLLVVIAYASSDVTVGNDRDVQFARLLDIVGDAIDSHANGPMILLGDLNAHSPQYGGNSVIQDNRGTLLTDWCAHRGLTVLNSVLCRGIATRPESNAVLDLAITNSPNLFDSMDIGDTALGSAQSIHLPRHYDGTYTKFNVIDTVRSDHLPIH